MPVGGDTRKKAVDLMVVFLEDEILPKFVGRSIVSTFLIEMAIQDAGLPEEIERYRPKARSEVLIRAMQQAGAEAYSRSKFSGTRVNSWILPWGKVKQ